MRTTFNGLPGLTHKTASHSYERILSRVPMIITSYKIYDWRKLQKNTARLDTGFQSLRTSAMQQAPPWKIPYWVTDSDAVVLWLARGERQLCGYWDWSEIPRCPGQYDSIQSNSTKTGWRVWVLSFENPLTCPVWKISAFWPGPTTLANFPSSAYVPWLAWSCQDPSSAAAFIDGLQ